MSIRKQFIEAIVLALYASYAAEEKLESRPAGDQMIEDHLYNVRKADEHVWKQVRRYEIVSGQDRSVFFPPIADKAWASYCKLMEAKASV